jgi:hypothetical protein
MDTVKKNLLGSLQKHQHSKARASMSMDPTNQSSKSTLTVEQNKKKSMMPLSPVL